MSIKIETSQTREASFAPQTINEATRTAELVWTTGARVKRGFFDPYLEELSLDPKHVRMERLNSGRTPLLDSHDRYSGTRAVLGVVESARLDGDHGVARVRFAKDDPEGERVWNLVRQGILRNVSVGYQVNKFEETKEVVDGLPVYRAIDWEPHELSIVTIGADAGAFLRGQAMPTDTNSNPQNVAQNDSTRAAIEAERERAATIRNLVARGKLEPALADKLVADGTPLQAARNIILNAMADESDKIVTDNHVRIEFGEDVNDKFARGAESAIIERAGLRSTFEAARKTDAGRDLPELVNAGEMRRWRLEDFARTAIEMRGVHTKGMSAERIFREAFAVRGGMASSSDFPVLLENTLGKTLLAAFATQTATWPQFCARLSVPDFRPANFYRNGSFGTLDKLNEGGEYQNKPIPDGEKSSISVDSYGNMITISRKALLNDDLGSFMDLASRFGGSAGRTVEASVYSLLAQNSGLGPTLPDGHPLFDAAHGNIGTGAALSVDSLDADAALMAAQKDPSGNDFLDLRPAVLLVPRGLEGTARVLNDAEYDPSVTSKFQVPNRVRGLFRTVVGTGRLEGTRRYQFSDPNAARVLAVAFLNGREAPEVFTDEGWRVDGTELKVRLDFGVAALDYRGAVTNAGTP